MGVHNINSSRICYTIQLTFLISDNSVFVPTKNKTSEMMNLKHLVLLICFAQILHYSAADNSTSALSSVIHDIIPDCYFGLDTIAFVVYTRETEDGVLFTTENMTRIDQFREYLSQEIAIGIHGFISSARNVRLLALARALLAERYVSMVMLIDWREGACTDGLTILDLVAYGISVSNVPTVGQYVANISKTMVDDYGADMNKIVLIGHSLGAHVASMAGKEAQRMNLGNYSQIIGLDPAGPLFSSNDCSERLCITDANFVQVIHTTITLGMSEAIGHVDFYMNRGILQPGCHANPSCSHSRSVEYLTSAVNSKCCFIGTPWTNYLFTQPISQCSNDTCSCVGLNAEDYPARGRFYVEIEADPPYCNNNGTVL